MITFPLNFGYVKNNPNKKVQKRLPVRSEHLESDLHYKKAPKKEILK
jgi:hypothetical protein